MQDDIDAAAGRGSATGEESGTSERRRIVRHLARAIWQSAWMAENPEADPAAQQAAWKAAREGQIANARKVLGKLDKRGVTMSLAAGADAEESADA